MSSISARIEAYRAEQAKKAAKPEAIQSAPSVPTADADPNQLGLPLPKGGKTE